MTPIPPSHIRRGVLTHGDDDWVALCGDRRPSSSFSLNHAVALYNGTIQTLGVVICAACAAKLEELMQP